MSRLGHEGICEHCESRFRFEVIHTGLKGSAYAYCDTCGITALLDARSEDRPGIVRHCAIEPEGERWLAPCACGGRFATGAGPRCPSCRGPLDAGVATGYVESAVRAVAAGWRWQRDWHGLYCLVVERRFVENPWDPRGPSD